MNKPEKFDDITMKLKTNILKDIEIDKNIHLRIIEEFGEKFIDFRKFYQERPTKHGIMIRLNAFKKIKHLIDE